MYFFIFIHLYLDRGEAYTAPISIFSICVALSFAPAKGSFIYGRFLLILQLFEVSSPLTRCSIFNTFNMGRIHKGEIHENSGRDEKIQKGKTQEPKGGALGFKGFKEKGETDQKEKVGALPKEIQKRVWTLDYEINSGRDLRHWKRSSISFKRQ